MGPIFSNLIKFGHMFYAHLGSKIFIIVLLTIISAFLDVLGISMLIPLLQSFSDVGQPETSSKIAQYIAFILGEENSKNTIFLLAVACIIFLFKGFFVFLSLGSIAYILSNFIADLKKLFFNLLKKVDYEYYISKDTGYFINLANEQINLSVSSFSNFAKFVSHLISTFIYLLATFFIAWKFSLLAFVGGAAVLVLFRPVSAYIMKISKVRVIETGLLANKLIQAIQSFKYLGATNQFGQVQNSINMTISYIASLNFRSNVASAIIQGLREPIIICLILLIFLVQTVLFQEQFAIVLASIFLFYRSINSLIGVQISWQATMESVGSMISLDDEMSRLRANTTQKQSIEVIPQQMHVEFSNVSFKFATNTDFILNNINIKITKNKTVALVGASGSGKSTILNLITLLLKPTKGKVLFDGLDSKKINAEELRSRIGYVSQENVVFDDTIENNITMWDHRGSRKLRDQKMRKAAMNAGIYDYVTKLPDNFHTKVGDRGALLSGGQRQRICIARELYKEPKLLILDEATSAVDGKSEKVIQDNILSLKGSMTIIIVTHSYSSILGVDEVFLFDSGRLVEHGSVSALIKNTRSVFSKNLQIQGIAK